MTIAGRKDGLNKALLRHLAIELGDNWEELVKLLGVSKMQLNTIKKTALNSENGGLDDVKFGVLVKWITQQPRGESQVKKLQEALEETGHQALADGLASMIQRFRGGGSE
ncbi:hypothetical protein NP493_62g00017 [Ridgeia piscesae]|uniref:Death domain-containing protein n=1 Tax=Ridgeia piscesae TaxID=27915 RepID=A0AAD9PA35_RIDPI|nr:hypothetical protein NP493_62g00017 [Ridgeia piscesae]